MKIVPFSYSARDCVEWVSRPAYNPIVAVYWRDYHFTEGDLVMKRLVSFFATLIVPALLFAGIGANQAMAQEKAKAGPPKVVLNVLLENDKVRVYDAQFAPGAETGSMARPARVVHVLAGGTLDRIYPDGKKESSTYKTGEVRFFDATPAYIVKNAGKSKVHLYVVNLK